MLAHDEPSTEMHTRLPGLTAADLKSLRVLYEDMREIMRKAGEHGVRVLMDAEQSWYQVRRYLHHPCVNLVLTQRFPLMQPATDVMTLLLAKEFNRADSAHAHTLPLLYWTFQGYLRRNLEHLQRSFDHAEQHGYTIGAKLVRGLVSALGDPRGQLLPASLGHPAPDLQLQASNTIRTPAAFVDGALTVHLQYVVGHLRRLEAHLDETRLTCTDIHPSEPLSPLLASMPTAPTLPIKVLIVGGGEFGTATALSLVKGPYAQHASLITILERSATPPASDAASSDLNKVRRTVAGFFLVFGTDPNLVRMPDHPARVLG